MAEETKTNEQLAEPVAKPAPKQAAKPAAKPAAKSAGKKFAIILIRSIKGATQSVKDTTVMLKLRKKHVCVVVPSSPSIDGMIFKIKDYVTYGEIDDSTLKLLLDKRSEPNPRDPKRTKGFFRLSPPRKGFERKGIKVPFVSGGALGYRGEKINDLLQRMI